MKATDTRPLGRTGLPVSQIGFGAAPLGNLYESFPDRQAYETVRAAWDAGIRLYDTAPLYGFGLSEHRIGEALRWERRADYVLSTKIGRLLHPADPATLDTGLFKGTLPFRPEYDYSYDGGDAVGGGQPAAPGAGADRHPADPRRGPLDAWRSCRGRQAFSPT